MIEAHTGMPYLHPHAVSQKLGPRQKPLVWLSCATQHACCEDEVGVKAWVQLLRSPPVRLKSHTQCLNVWYQVCHLCPRCLLCGHAYIPLACCFRLSCSACRCTQCAYRNSCDGLCMMREWRFVACPVAYAIKLCCCFARRHLEGCAGNLHQECCVVALPLFGSFCDLLLAVCTPAGSIYSRWLLQGWIWDLPTSENFLLCL